MTSDAASFDDVASIYDSARPSYPRASAEFLVDEAARTVADVGAGTGAFTRLLLRPGRRVIAIEPSANMLTELHRGLPDVEAVAGTGERMPLAEASVDVITFAQSWHWVDVPTASAEAARVLRAGGTLGLIWNLRDERVDWVRELGIAMRADGDHYRGGQDDPEVGVEFAGPERSHVEWKQRYSRAALVEMVRSRSYFSRLSAQERAVTVAAVNEVVDRNGAGAGEGSVMLPYVTASFRYTLRRTDASRR